MLKKGEIEKILEKANVPEHSAAFMQAMSGGEPFLIGDYLFVAAEDWLLAIGYPLEHIYIPQDFDKALRAAVGRTGARDCWAVCPELPARLKQHGRGRDFYYILSADSPIPARLERLAERASAGLKVERSTDFGPAHRRLWAEFTARKPLPPNVQKLFLRTGDVIAKVDGLSLLNAWDLEGNLAASLLIDEAPARFTTYLLGAHSRKHYTPYASDLLFREMIASARRSGKDFLHLGLGVNDGIRKFKTKWGARPGHAYEYAAWCEEESVGRDMSDLIRSMAASQPISKQEFMASLPKQRPFRMIWEVEKDGRRSWIGGTAHFFCYSFESSFRSLFEKVDAVLFEGPLDPASLDSVAEIGRNPEPDAPRIIDHLSEEEIRRLERVVCGPRGFWARLLGSEWKNAPDVRHLLAETRHWMAFFSLWTGYLARQGWKESVDREAWQIAREMCKSVHYMESIPEQVETLESIPVPRIIGFLRSCRAWGGYTRRFVRAYLKGNVDGLYGTSVEFPSRTDTVIQRRDAIFLDRMKPFLEAGSTAVFVGSAHMINLRGMLADAGYRIRRYR
jgi:uncharacterized protein YbaP (TraB family)